MGKYEVRWCRIWDFAEEVETETEEEVFKKILEERATAGSTIEIISVMPIDIEEVKLGNKREYLKGGEFIADVVPKTEEAGRKKTNKKVVSIKKEKK